MAAKCRLQYEYLAILLLVFLATLSSAVQSMSGSKGRYSQNPGVKRRPGASAGGGFEPGARQRPASHSSLLCAPPPTPNAGYLSCKGNERMMKCQAGCRPGYFFPNGKQEMLYECYDDVWSPSNRIPDCEPVCDPECENGGRCYRPNGCLCTQEFRGSHCQYPLSLCDGNRLGFIGIWRCNHTHEETRCVIDCPPGTHFDEPPPLYYHCSLEGVWSPSEVPKCVFPVPESGENFHFGQETSAGEFGGGTHVGHPYPPQPHPPFGSFGHGFDDADGFHQPPFQEPFPDTISGSDHFQEVGKEETPKSPLEDLYVQPKSSGVCTMWSPFHYRTFDGQLFRFPGLCPYILAKDIQTQTFIIESEPQEQCASPTDCPRNLVIYLPHSTYYVNLRANRDPIVTKDGGPPLSIPSFHQGLQLQREAQYVVLKSPLGFSVFMDGMESVSIRIDDEALKGSVCGLCGFYNGILADDFRTPNGYVIADPIQFGNSWIGSYRGDCPDVLEDVNPCSYAERTVAEHSSTVCANVLSPQFASCHKFVLPHPYYNACQSDCCIKQGSDECECDALKEYIRECVRLGGTPPPTWLQGAMCASRVTKPCTNGSVYDICGSACVATCNNPNPSCPEKDCVDGCHCPKDTVKHNGHCIPLSECPCVYQKREYQKGEEIQFDCNTCICDGGEWKCTDAPCPGRCVLSGQSHYTTFDGLHYNFIGPCTYYLVHHPEFTITQENGNCLEPPMASRARKITDTVQTAICIKGLVLKTQEGTEIKLRRNLEVIVNGREILELPAIVPGAYISQPSSLFLEVFLANGVSLMWDGEHLVFIHVPPVLTDTIKGLCGTFNGNQADEFLTPEGIVEISETDFANKWKVLDTCPDALPPGEVMSLCDMHPDLKSTAEVYCSALLKDIFSGCHDFVEALPYYQSCLHDMCSCMTTLHECLCPTYADYASACAKKGHIINWRPKIPECGIHCTGGQEYQPCVRSCEYSCMQLSLQSKNCDENKCVEGCACPPGLTLDAEGVCVPLSECPCVYKGREYNPGFTQLRGSQMCLCSRGQWECRNATLDELVLTPAPNIEKPICLESEHQEYTDCVSECPLSCHTMHEKSALCTSAICKPGCKCKEGFVIDADSGKCVKPSQCPCHHGGRSYNEGDTVNVDCNKCICEGGHWQCEDQVCEGVCQAWGDSHYKTFDGRFYSFQGDCDYVMTKGEVDDQKPVSIVVQNVLCGSAGLTCSKSAMFSIGNESITLMRDRPIPTLPPDSIFTVEEVGLFVIVRASVGVTLLWDKGTRVYVRVDPVWRNKLRGLCGNFNGDPNDDFKTGAGDLSVVNPAEFADSWTVQEFCLPPHPVEDACAYHPQRKSWATQKCAVIKSPLFAPCHSEVPPEKYYESCVFDSCGCDIGGDCECLCTAIAAYGHECAAHGVPILWRSQQLCPIQCEDCDHYSACISPCPKETCESLKNPSNRTSLCRFGICVEGCDKKPCPPGQIYNNEDEMKCVPVEECQTQPTCTINGIVYQEGQRIKDDSVGDKCQACHCRNGEVKCIGQPCTTVQPEGSTLPTSRFTSGSLKECQHGWTEWMNSVKPSLETGGDFEEIQGVFKSYLRTVYHIYCPDENITKIECREVATDIPYDETGQDVTCELPRGLLCHNSNQKNHLCLDYKIRVFCDCGGPQEGPTTPGSTPGSTTESTTESITTTNPLYICPEGVHWDNCAYHCDKMCHSFRHEMIVNEGHCVHKSCVFGCQHAPCESPQINRDRHTCVMPEECTCALDDGTILSPGEVVEHDCEKCQCLNNSLICSTIIGCKEAVLPQVPSTEIAAITEPPKDNCWTEWFNTDKPDGPGDFENFNYIRAHYNVCASPVAIECREVRTKLDYKQSKYYGRCHPLRGFKCWNDIQESGSCSDFEVRFFCPCETIPAINYTSTTTTTTTSTTTTTTTTTTTSLLETTPTVTCQQGWTPWFNEHRPDAEGEYETLQSIIEHGNSVCSPQHTSITAIQCRVAGKPRLSYDKAGQRDVTCDLENGFYCENKYQAKGKKCYDYEVRYFCDCEDVAESFVSSTTVVSEPEEPATTSPWTIGVGTTACTDHWSDWIDLNNPWGKNFGDFESVHPDVLVSRGFCTKGRITSIDCRDESNRDYTETGEVGLTCSVRDGFSCFNSRQTDHLCLNYKIRYLCSCSRSPYQEPLVVYPPQQPIFPECQHYYPLIDGPYHLSDLQFKASSSLSPLSGPQNIRMSSHPGPNSDGAWIPETLDEEQFVEIDLGVPQALYGVVTLGRENYPEWVTSYYIDYSENGINFWYYHDSEGSPKIITGNFDSDTKVQHIFEHPFEARFVRIHPLTWHGQIALRADLIGCSEAVTTTPPEIEKLSTLTPVITVPPKHEVCIEPMGLENQLLSDSQITASSQHNLKNGPKNVRLDSSSWVPLVSDDSQYIQIDFLEPRNVTAIITKGRPRIPQWVTSFIVLYGQDGDDWNPIKDKEGNDMVFAANFDSDTPVTNYFPNMIRTRYLRVLPTRWKNWIALRMEVLGCYHPYPTITTTPVVTIPEEIMNEVRTVECAEPMGFENGHITNDMIRATSFALGSSPAQLRLNTKAEAGKLGGWVPTEGDQNQFIELNLRKPTILNGIITQGREDLDNWVTSFSVLVSNDTTNWQLAEGMNGEEELQGNIDRNTPNRNMFKTPVIGQYVKILPITWHESIGLRMELVGCFHPTLTSTPTTTTAEKCIETGPWLSLSVPTPGNEGDFEPIKEVIAASKLCNNPIDIECREYTTQRDYQRTGQNVTCDLTHGLICRHSDQSHEHCFNYEVRIKCWNCGSTTPLTTTPIAILPVALCPEVPNEMAEHCPSSCPPGLVCDGEHCIDPVDCPCVHNGKKFNAGDVIEKVDGCEECLCVLEGHSSCTPKKCPACPSQKEKTVLAANCTCICEGCSDNERLCPTSGKCIHEDKWCDDVVDCPDDETNCLTPISTSVPSSCPPLKMRCPKGRKAVIKNPNGPGCPTYYCSGGRKPKIPKEPEIPPIGGGADCEIVRQYIKTFDGQELAYEICDHIVFKDIVQNRFNASVSKHCLPFKTSQCKKLLEINDGKYNLIVDTDLVTTFNGHAYQRNQLPYLNKRRFGINLQVAGTELIFRSLEHGYVIMWDNDGNLLIDVSESLKDQVSGLCGYYNNDISDDKSRPDGTLAFTTQSFGNSWKNNNNAHCEEHVCPPDILIKADKECAKLREAPFDACEDVLPVSMYEQACLNYMCGCMQDNYTTDSECKCEAYLPMLQACETALQKDLRGWRMKHSCGSPECPEGLEWNDCGPSCDISCDVDSTNDESCHDECVPGCFCPAGQVRDGDTCKSPEKCSDTMCEGFGDPFIATYDGLQFSFQVSGRFLLTRNNERSFEVFGITDLCSATEQFACIVGLDVVYLNNTLKIRKGKPVQMNDDVISMEEVPVEMHEMLIFGFPGQTVFTIIPDISTQVKYFEMNNAFSIEVPSRQFFNKTTGLCGNCNFKEDDDTADEDVRDFVCTWLIDGDHERCLESFNEQSRNIESPVCKEIWSPDFASCHALVDPSTFAAVCQDDVAHGQKPEKALCFMMMAYARHCCQAGEVIDVWAKKYNCPLNCPETMEFDQCHSACPQTCNAKNSTLMTQCSLLKTDGCRCPEGKVLQDGKCVDAIMCEICDKDGHKPGEEWQKGPCERCKCTFDLEVECIKEKCPFPPVCKSNEMLHINPATNDTCCDVYVCVPQSAASCAEPDIPTCKEGEIAKIQFTENSTCPKYECECDPVLCPPIMWPLNVEPGHKTELVKGPCCTKLEVVCDTETCPQSPECSQGLKLKIYPGECCNTYKCEPPEDRCLYAHMYGVEHGFEYPVIDEVVSEYMPGTTWKDGLCNNCTCEGKPGQYAPKCVHETCPQIKNLPDDKDYELSTLPLPDHCCPAIVRMLCKDEDGNVKNIGTEWKSKKDPCTTYKCVRHPYGEAQKVVQTTTCPECPKASEYVYPSPSLHQCCGICRPFACEEGDVIYKVGDRWNSTTRKCYTAECVKDAFGIRPLYSRVDCPAIPENCPQEYLITDETGCCQKCNVTLGGCIPMPVPLQETIGFYMTRDKEHGICSNKQIVPGTMECGGTCESHSYYSLDTNSFNSNCLCCTPSGWENRSLELECQDGGVISKMFKHPISCHCSPCSSGENPTFMKQIDASEPENHDLGQKASFGQDLWSGPGQTGQGLEDLWPEVPSQEQQPVPSQQQSLPSHQQQPELWGKSDDEFENELRQLSEQLHGNT